MSILRIILLIVGVSQLYWAWRFYSFTVARIPSRGRRAALYGMVLAIYLLMYEFTFGVWRDRETPVHLTLRDALLAAPFLWWIASSLFAFLVALLFTVLKGIVYGVHWILIRLRADGADIQSPARRWFLERTAAVATGAPFVAGTYGLFYGRLNLE